MAFDSVVASLIRLDKWLISKSNFIARPGRLRAPQVLHPRLWPAVPKSVAVGYNRPKTENNCPGAARIRMAKAHPRIRTRRTRRRSTCRNGSSFLAGGHK